MNFFQRNINVIQQRMKDVDWFSLFILIYAVLGFFSICTNIYSIFSSPLGMADESWYIYLIRAQKSPYGTSFPFYFRFLSSSSVVLLRSIGFLMDSFASVLLSVALYCFFRNKLCKRDLYSIVIIGLCCKCIINPQCVTCPSYIQLEYFFGTIAVASVLFAFATTHLKQVLWFLICGFSCVQLFFVMPPSGLFSVAILITIIIYNKNGFLSFAIGCIVGLSGYFIIIQSPGEYYLQILQFKSLGGNVNDHNAMLLIKWAIRTTDFLINGILICTVAVCMLWNFNFKNRSVKKLFLLCPVSSFLIILIKRAVCVFHTTAYGYPIELLYVVFFLVWYVWYEKQKLSIKENWMLFFFATVPVLLSFGTDVNFAVRGLCYAVFVFLPTVVIAKIIKDHFIFFINFCVVIVFCVFFVLQFHATSWATGERFFGQTVCSSAYAAGMPISQKQQDTFNILTKNMVNRKFIVGDPASWQYVVALDKEPLGFAFRYAKEDLTTKFKESDVKKTDIGFIETISDNHSLYPEWKEKYRLFFNADRIREISISKDQQLVIFE